MLPNGFQDVLATLPQAMLRVNASQCVTWVEPSFQSKTGLIIEPGSPLVDVLEPGRARDALERALREGRPHTVHVVTCALKQVRAQVLPAENGGAWIVLEASGADDDITFSHALQEIARALGETLDVDAVCASAVMAMVRCTQVQRAEVFLVEEGLGVRRVAMSDVEGPGAAVESLGASTESFQLALVTRQPQIGVQRTGCGTQSTLFAAVPLLAQRRTLGVLVLYKDAGSAFSVREVDLWTAASGQLAVAVENARLLRETKAALQIRDEFMSIASHELKTPLTPLKLSLYSMERRISQGQPVELSSVLKSKRQVDRLIGLIDDLLDASRLELGKLAVHPAPLELGQLVAEVVDHFRLAFERPFHLEVPRERIWIRGDRDRLEQVLVNLLDNANKYSPAHEPVSIEVGQLDGEAFLSVSDRGIGIPHADQGQIFQRFYRAGNASHRNFGGLGLGLFISHSIAKLHGGQLVLSRSEECGSTFTLSLPRMTARDVRGLPRRVLLFEEDEMAEAAAERILSAEGFEVLCARDGAEALRKASQAPVDLLILSATAPSASAACFLETLAGLPRARPLPLLFTGTRLPDWARAKTPLCSKPFERESLLVCVLAAMHWAPHESERRSQPRYSALEEMEEVAASHGSQ